MKRTLLIMSLCAMASLAFALGNNKGNTRANATDFNWEDPYYERNSANPWWFQIDVTDLKQMSNPTLALYITNLSSTQTATVTASLYFGSSNTSMEDQTFTLAPGQYRIMSANVNAIKNFSFDVVQLQMTVTGTTDLVSLSGKALETVRADLACKTNTTLTIDGPEVAGTASQTTWYNFDIKKYTDDTKQLKVIVTPSAAATVKTSLSYDCPCTGSTDETASVAAGASQEIVLRGDVLEAVQELRAYISVNSTAPYKIKVVEEASVPAPTVPVITPTTYDFETHGDGYDLTAGNNWFVFEYDSIIDDLIIPNVVLTAASGADVTVDMGYKNASGEVVVLDSYDWSFAGAKKAFPLDVNVLTGSKNIFKDGTHYYVYYRIHTSVSDLHFKMLVNAISSGSEDCSSYVELTDWAETPGVSLTLDWEALGSTAYEDFQGKVNLANFKDFKINGHHVDVKVSIQDYSGASNTIKIAQVNCSSPLTENSYASRTLAADETKTKIIKYSQYSAYEDELLFRIKASGEYWLHFEAVEAVEVNETACLTNTDFDWRFGHNVAAGSDVWFEVDLDTVHNTTFIPVMNIRNDGAANAKVKVQYAYECPVTYELAAPASHTISVGKTYTENLTRESLLGIESKKLYVRLVSDQDVYFSISFDKDNDYADRLCNAALDFNWVGGNTQTDTTLWYAIDLSYAKAEKKIIKLHIKNEGSVSSNVTADIAFSCPYENLTNYHTTIAAGATKNAPAIPYDAYAENDFVWVRLKNVNSKIHFWADLEDDTFVPVSICDLITPANELNFDSPITITTDSVWYWYKTSKFTDPDFSDLSYVPEITVVNPTSSAITAKVYTAYHCHITSSMMSRTQRFAAGSTFTKALERDMVDNYVTKYDTVFVCIVGAAGLEVNATMIDPNLGSDCAHAIAFQYGTSATDKRGHKQAAGEDMWYKLDVNAAHGKKVLAGIANLTTHSVTANVALYISCDGDAVEKGSRSLTALAHPEREVGELLSGLAVNYIYLNVKATDSVHVYAYFDGDLPTGPEINVCDDPMTKIEPNIHYYQGAATYEDGVWYYVDIAALDTTTKGDAVVTITPKGATPVKLKADLYWQCHTNEIPSSKTQTITTTYTKTLTRETLDALSKDSAFIRIFASDSIDFIIEVNSLKGRSCQDPVEFDWEFCNTQPKDEWVWYHINVDSLNANPDKDLRLNIENLEDYMVTVKVDSIVITCGEAPMMSIGNKTLAANEIKTQDVDNSLLQDFNITSTGLSLKVWADGQVHICPTLIPALEDSIVRDTVYRTVCRGGDFLDPFFSTNPDSIDAHCHTIRDIQEDYSYSDTIAFRYDGTFHGDSIRWYEIHVIDAPVFTQPLDSSKIHSLVLDPGKAIDDVVRAAIFSELLDSIKVQPFTSWIDSTTTASALGACPAWKAGTWNDVTRKYEFTDALSDTLTSPFINNLNNGEFGLEVSYVDTCGNVIADTLVLSFTDNRCESFITHTDTVCAGFTFRSFTITADTAIIDTCIYVNATADQKCDSIVTYQFHVYTHNYTRPEETQYPTMQAGKALYYTDAEAALKANFADDNTYAPEITSVTWMYSVADAKTSPYYTTPDILSATDADSAWVAFKMLTDCGDEIYDTLHIGLTAADTLRAIETHKLCYNETFVSSKGGIYTANVASQEWSDTIHNVVVDGVLDQKFDSIYFYTLQTIVPTYDSVKHVMCQGETFTWHGVDYTTSQTDLHDTIHVAYTEGLIGCDSVWGVLNLTVNPTYVTNIADTVCMAELQYVWHVSDGTTAYNAFKDNTYILANEGAGVHTYTETLRTVNGCDSVLNFTLTIGEEFDGGNFTQSVCLGSDYEWINHRVITAPATVGTYEYYDSAKTVLGCDSVYKLTLKVVDPTPAWFYGTLCKGETYTWTEGGNKQYNTADSIAVGVYRDSLWSVTDLGCDSLTVLQLTINPVYSFYDTVAICDNETYQWHGMTLNAANAGDNSKTYPTIGCGCDSTYNLFLIVNPTYNQVQKDTICFEDEIDLGLNGGLTKIKQSGNYVEKRKTIGCNCDSIITHEVIVRSTFALPTNTDTVPQIVCGSVPLLDNINREVEEWLANNVKPENEQVSGTPVWQIYNNVTRAWETLSLTTERYDEGHNERLRYFVVTDCGTTIESPVYEVPVEMPSTDNIYSMLQIEALSKYDDWLLLINLNKVTADLKALGFPAPKESEVIWYWDQMGTGMDLLDENGVPSEDDVEVTRGYYCTEDHQLDGLYYAVIRLDNVQGNQCGIALRSTTIICQNSTSNVIEEPVNNGGSTTMDSREDANTTVAVGTTITRPDFKAPVISPTMVNAGGQVYVYNLNPEITTTIEIYDVMGNRIDVVKVSGVDTYPYMTSDMYTGYFMMNISSEEDTRALRYIAK